MTPETRNRIEDLLRQVHEILVENRQVRGGDWAFNGVLSDGRAVRHKFALGGYVRTGPQADRDREALGIAPYAQPAIEEWVSRNCNPDDE